MLRAAKRGVPLLFAEGFEDDGSVRRSLGIVGTGNLRDQGDAGSGLLAYHALTGDPRAIAAAAGIAEVLQSRFWDDERKRFRNVARDSDLPDVVRDELEHPGWNGVALRFLAEFGAIAPETKWRELVRESLDAWAAALPWDAHGMAELGRAALRIEDPMPVLVITADPDSPEGAELRDIACRILDRVIRIRWIGPNVDSDVADAFGIRLEEEPAIYLVWDRATLPIRDAVTLKAAYDDGVERVRGPEAVAD
jgi:uncharacterized protein YyaL (SSP411 family)